MIGRKTVKPDTAVVNFVLSVKQLGEGERSVQPNGNFGKQIKGIIIEKNIAEQL